MNTDETDEVKEGSLPMALIPYEPFRQLDQWRREMDRWFQEFPFRGILTGGEWGPHRIDVYETDREVVALCDLPGLQNKDDVSIEVDGQTLTISGTINRSEEVRDERMHRRERFYGRFHRTVSLPVAVQEEGVTASYRNGVLEIRMPKAEQRGKRRVDIQFH